MGWGVHTRAARAALRVTDPPLSTQIAPLLGFSLLKCEPRYALVTPAITVAVDDRVCPQGRFAGTDLVA